MFVMRNGANIGPYKNAGYCERIKYPSIIA